jgi:ARG and Rhodanese-Phosphatase-superfamily-associated Protein domain
MLNLENIYKNVQVAPATVFGGLAIYPLITKNPLTRDYLTLGEAFEQKGVEITEVSDGGSVPELRLKNLLEKDIFAADGETLIGAKQNRVLNSSIYVAAGEEIVVPVSCVESGRWRYKGRRFGQSDYSEFVPSRAAKMTSVSESLKCGAMSRRSDQGAVWGAVALKGTEFDSRSSTSSMTDFYESKRRSLDEYVRNFSLLPNQVGVCAVVDGDVVALEMFEEPGIMQQFFQKLLLAYAAEVVARPSRASVIPDTREIRSLLKQLGKASYDRYTAVGNGEEFRFSMGSLQGTALLVGERLIHLVMLRKGRRRNR